MGKLCKSNNICKKELKQAVFVAFENSLNSSKGGQQVCTQELITLLEKTGYCLKKIAVTNRLKNHQRLINRFQPIAYPERWPAETIESILYEIKKHAAGTVFFNLIDFIPIARQVRSRLGNKVRLVLLSHGLASADAVHINRIAKEMPELVRKTPIYNIQKLIESEVKCLSEFDAIVSISEVEAEMCRWLGAKKSIYIPRFVPLNPLKWKPIEQRVGLVGTLDHLPTIDGIVRVLEKIPLSKSKDIQVRVVSHSAWHGKWLARRFPCVEFLGALDEKELRNEASSWCCFLNPIFCFARGCSTKLAVGLGWGIPCLTTSSGLRGYKLPPNAVKLAENPLAYAEKTMFLSKISNAKIEQKSLQDAQKRFLGWKELAREFTKNLG